MTMAVPEACASARASACGREGRRVRAVHAVWCAAVSQLPDAMSRVARHVSVLLLAAVLCACAHGGAAPGARAPATDAPVLLWETRGFNGPESVVFDRARNRYYVSNMASWGKDAVPGDGYISLLDGEGRVLERQWLAGLGNPKGLAIAGGRLYVGDDDALVEIDPASARVLARHQPADGPGGFNDVTADAAGNVYVFSRRLGTVFRLSQGRFAPWAALETRVTGRPNGLRVDGGRLLMGSWVVPADAPAGEGAWGHLATLDLGDRRPGRIGDAPLGHIDGIEPDGRGGYTVTDWTRGLLLQVGADGTARTLLTLEKGAADHLYQVEEQVLVVPQLLDGVVRAWRWAPRTGE